MRGIVAVLFLLGLTQLANGQGEYFVDLPSEAGAYGKDAVAECAPLPRILRFDQPAFPPDVELRGLPNPVSLMVEFIVTAEGRATDLLVVESDAGSYAREFSERAVRAAATMQFEGIRTPCRGRMKIVFKVVD
jgi:hypothetical protein